MANTEYRFAFDVTNPATAQDSPAGVQIAATVGAGSDIAAAAMAKPGTALRGVVNGADPLRVAVASFSVRAIGQSNPYAGAVNTMTVTVAAAVALAENDVVTISGLKSSQTTGTARSLAVGTTNGCTKLGTQGDWTQSSGALKLTVAAGGLGSSEACTLTFVLQNPSTAQDSQPVSIAASGTVTISNEAMTTPGTSLAQPLKVVHLFTTRAIGQSNPTAGATNTITATLVVATALAAGDVVTIAGLTGTQTGAGTAGAALALRYVAGGNSGDQRFASAVDDEPSRGEWAQNEGALRLRVRCGGLAANTEYRFAFDVLNQATAQSSPPGASISASGSAASGPVAMTSPGTSVCLHGVCGGADPLKVVEQNYFAIGQSSPVAGAANTLTVTIVTTKPLVQDDTVTISGLTGAIATNGDGLALSQVCAAVGAGCPAINTGDAMFKDGGGAPKKGTWDNTAMKLTLKVAAAGGLVAKTEYKFSFVVTNPAAAQASPDVKYAQDDADAATNDIAATSMTTPGKFLSGTTDPLNVIVQHYFAIGQSSPLAGATNTMTVTLITGTDLAAGDTVTISGLKGATTADNTALALGGRNTPTTSTTG